MQQDTYVKFTSHLGNSFVAPSQWTADDKGDTYSLRSPDGQAAIHAIMFTAQGSGSVDEFCQTMTSSLVPKGVAGWKPSPWSKIKLGDDEATTRVLVPDPEAGQEWRVYVLSTGRFYYAVILNASTNAMALNGGFYENVVRTFHGISG